jgi:PAS domain S-box-containing protein
MKMTSQTYTSGSDHESIPEKNKETLPPTNFRGSDAVPGSRSSGITSYLFIVISMLILSTIYILFFNIIAEHLRENSLRKARISIERTLAPAYASIRSDIAEKKRFNAGESAMITSITALVRAFNVHSDPHISSFFLIGYDGRVIVPVEHDIAVESAATSLLEEKTIYELVSIRPDRENPQLFMRYIDKTSNSGNTSLRIACVTAIPEIHSYIGVRLKFDKIHEEERILMSIAKYGSIVILLLFLLPMLYSYIVISRRNRVLNLRNKMMRAIFDNTQQYMMLIDRQSAVIEINNRVIEVFDTAREDVLCKNIKDTPMWNIPADLRDRITHGFDQAFGGEVVKNIIVSILRKTGTTIQINFTLSPVTGLDGKVIFIIAEGRDITQQVQTETQLEKSEERYRLTAEASRDALWETDLRTGDSYFSDRWYEICKYDRNDFGGLLSLWETVIHPDDFEKAYDIFKRYSSGEIEGWMRNEFRIFDKTGILRWILIQRGFHTGSRDRSPT